MKKVAILIFSAICIASCANNQSENKTNAATIDPEVAEYIKQFNTVKSIEDAKLENIDIKAFQILNKNECLAHEISNKQYGWYDGSIVYYVTFGNELIYDDKVIKGKAYLVGTYTYETIAGGERTVKVYIDDYDFAVKFLELAKQVNN